MDGRTDRQKGDYYRAPAFSMQGFQCRALINVYMLFYSTNYAAVNNLKVLWE